VKDIIHIKEVFPTASSKKFVEINNIINKSGLVKPKVDMTTKKLSIKSINRSLQEANLNILADFICLGKLGIIITINQVTFV